MVDLKSEYNYMLYCVFIYRLISFDNVLQYIYIYMHIIHILYFIKHNFTD